MGTKKKNKAPATAPEGAPVTPDTADLDQKLIAAAHESVRCGRQAAAEAFAALAGENWSGPVPVRTKTKGE